jgi:hypothetical protein
VCRYEHRNTNTGLPEDGSWRGDLIDFADMLGAKCKPSEYVDMQFMPNAFDDNHCVLGQQLVYKRKKDCTKNEPCLNALDFELEAKATKNCGSSALCGSANRLPGSFRVCFGSPNFLEKEEKALGVVPVLVGVVPVLVGVVPLLLGVVPLL